MAESINTTVVENLPENAAPGDADYIITAQKNILKKTKIAQLVNVFKEKLGINTLNTKINTCPRYVIYNVNTDTSGNVFLNTSKDGHQILGAFPLYGNIRITAVGYYNGAYYAFCNDFDGGSCANRPVTIGVLYID